MSSLLTFLAAGAMSVSSGILFDRGDLCAAAPDGVGAAIPCTAGGYINQTYGDTSQVNVTYEDVHSGTSLRFWPANYNSLLNVIWADGTDDFSFGRIRLELLIPGTIALDWLDMGAFDPEPTRATNLRIHDLDGGGTLYSFSGNVGNPGTPISTGTAFSFAGVSSTRGLVIEWENSAYNVAVDNVEFTITLGVVPEPGSMAMMMLGTGVLLMLSWRRRQA